MATLLFKKRSKDGKRPDGTSIGPRCRFRLGVSHLLHLFTTTSQLYLSVSIGIRFVSQRIHTEAEMREAKKTGLLYKRPDGRLTRTVLLFGHMSQKKKQRREMQRCKAAV